MEVSVLLSPQVLPASFVLTTNQPEFLLSGNFFDCLLSLWFCALNEKKFLNKKENKRKQF